MNFKVLRSDYLKSNPGVFIPKDVAHYRYETNPTQLQEQGRQTGIDYLAK